MTNKTNIRCTPDGPLLVRGLEKLASADGSRTWPITAGKPVALCRCGASENKPFCDGKHREAGFSDLDARPVEGRRAGTASEGPGEIRVSDAGPLAARGDVALDGFEGEAGGEELYLCRCGASGNKPFCDGSHAKVGFTG